MVGIKREMISYLELQWC